MSTQVPVVLSGFTINLTIMGVTVPVAVPAGILATATIPDATVVFTTDSSVTTDSATQV